MMILTKEQFHAYDDYRECVCCNTSFDMKEMIKNQLFDKYICNRCYEAFKFGAEMLVAFGGG